jgi:hypothetical protein
VPEGVWRRRTAATGHWRAAARFSSITLTPRHKSLFRNDFLRAGAAEIAAKCLISLKFFFSFR